ncbi:helix-turn-helix domain-containing protein [Microvirga yunnanensis]|uniref:helix-turn-helix domain-containing protein n=1 Tax=Microvirga yunnanensis TaxID=2953740 RepID=UPI0021C7D1C1|nr:helix-turn-helix transcriptional regulator [Microvirga sp. HBU65207]
MVNAAQIKAARALLGWSQDELCERADIHRRTLTTLESGKIQSYDSTINRVVIALESAGVQFFEQDGGGYGVLIRPSTEP